MAYKELYNLIELAGVTAQTMAKNMSKKGKDYSLGTKEDPKPKKK